MVRQRKPGNRRGKSLITRELQQARKGIKKLVNSNRTIIIIHRKPLTGDGFGGEVEDPFGAATGITVKCRLSHDAIAPAQLGEVSSGFTSDPILYILVDNAQDIVQDDIFEALSKKWKIGLVDTLHAHNGIIGYQAPLFEAETIEEVS